VPSVDPSFATHLKRVLAELGLALDARQTGLLEAHYGALQLWNRRINLTAIRDSAEIAERHFGEALFLARELGQSPGSLLDIGSGAGFPGMPVAVCHPATRVTLLEPVGKKTAFLKEVSRSLSNVSVLQGRLDAVEGVFEWATVRG
jgi:16S rRNA (guanine527-N7)-methyltransferase